MIGTEVKKRLEQRAKERQGIRTALNVNGKNIVE